MDRVRESCASVCFIWGISSGFPLANRLIMPGSGSSTLSQGGFQCRGLWEGWHHLLWGDTPSLFNPARAFLCMGGWESLWPQELRNMYFLYLLSGQDLAPLCPCYYVYLGVSAHRGFPGSSVAKNLPANMGNGRDMCSIPGLGRSPGAGNGNIL